MRITAALALAVLLLASLPVQGAEVDQVLVEDRSGDVVITSRDGTVPPQSNSNFRDVDLTAVGLMAETEETLTFFVEVDSLQKSSQNPLPFSDPNFDIRFHFGEQGYRVRVFTVLDNPANAAFSREQGAFVRLEQQVGEQQFRPVASGEAELDFGASRVYATVPRAGIVDQNQAPLGLGSQLSDIWATASSMGWFQFPVGQTQQGGDPLLYAGAPMAVDQAPDALTSLPAYTLTTGAVKAKGGLVAVSADPVRWTNGEASTLRFEATVTNTGDHDIPIKVGVRGTKPEWTLAYSDSLTVPRGQSLNTTFLVTIPFSHNHGSLHMFEAVFESLDGAHFAAADLGVYWPAVPQPAGHHDTIWLHSMVETQNEGFFSAFDSGVHAWMSAIEDDENDEQVAIPSMFTVPPNTFTGGKALAFWRVMLEPELRMGLDFRPQDLGAMELQVNFPVSVVDPQVRVELSHVEVRERQGRDDDGLGDETTLATAQSAPAAGTLSGDQLFTLELAVTEDADEIPYQTRTNLVLTIVVEATFIAGFGSVDPAAIAPHLLPGGSWMRLPLNEYMDPVDLSFQTDGSLELLATTDGQAREVNPGKTVVYVFDLKYHGTNATTLRTLVTGTNPAWATIVGDQEFKMEPHGERRVGLAVKAPAGTSPGERADLTLTVLSTANAAVQAGINTVTTVTTSTDIPDESERGLSLDKELSAKKNAPALPLVAVLGALVLALRRPWN